MNPYEIWKRMFGYDLGYDGRNVEKRTHSKHRGSKRGYKHARRMSLGEKRHLEYTKGVRT